MFSKMKDFYMCTLNELTEMTAAESFVLPAAIRLLSMFPFFLTLPGEV